MNEVTVLALPDWARVAGRPSASARIRHSADDFVVREELGFDLSGDGDHDYLYVTKRGQNTAYVAGLLARYAGVAKRDVSYSGLKDRNAVTSQWFSVKSPARRDIDWGSFEAPSVNVDDVVQHRRKLRRGAHRWNHFRLVLRDLDDPDASLEARLRRVREAGVPNYFGEQRFGRAGRNLEMANALFSGARLGREKRSLALSAARAVIFNAFLSERVRDDCWDVLRSGDVAGLEGSGSIFGVDEVDETLAQRASAFDLHPTGPLWGAESPTSTGEVAAAEDAAAQRYAVLKSGLEGTARAGRRALRLVVRDLKWSFGGASVTLEFSLSRGGFATSVLRELVTYEL